MHKKNNPDWPTSLSGFFVSCPLAYFPEKTILLVCSYLVYLSTSKIKKSFFLFLPSHPHPSDRKHAACRGFYGWASDSIGRARIKQLFTGSTAMLDLWHQNALLLLYLRRLCTFKDVAIKGKLYSSEFNQSFETKRSICAIKENENGKFDFNIDGVPHVSWFRKR